MNEAERQDLRQEIRASAWAYATTVPPYPPCVHDRDAEEELVAAASLGVWPSEPLHSEDFFGTMTGGLYEVMGFARACGAKVTISLLVRGLRELGARGPYLETAVTNLMDVGSIAPNPDAAAHRVRSFAWRRRLVSKLDRLRAMLVEPAFSDVEIETELDRFVELGAAQPHPMQTP